MKKGVIPFAAGYVLGYSASGKLTHFIYWLLLALAFIGGAMVQHRIGIY